ncbi:TetR family transcriptional regulator [Amnibacterium kyonggiense]
MALTREEVLHEALRLSDDEGLDGLSLRKLATRLGVQAPSLYWYVANKAALLDAISDAIMGEAIDDLPEPSDGLPWQDWLLGAFIALRRAMLAHRDSARIISGAHDSLRRAEFTERAIERLVGAGVELREAWLMVLGGTRYTLGHVYSEQGPDAAPSSGFDAGFRERFPSLQPGSPTTSQGARPTTSTRTRSGS